MDAWILAPSTAGTVRLLPATRTPPRPVLLAGRRPGQLAFDFHRRA